MCFERSCALGLWLWFSWLLQMRRERDWYTSRVSHSKNFLFSQMSCKILVLQSQRCWTAKSEVTTSRSPLTWKRKKGVLAWLWNTKGSHKSPQGYLLILYLHSVCISVKYRAWIVGGNQRSDLSRAASCQGRLHTLFAHSNIAWREELLNW